MKEKEGFFSDDIEELEEEGGMVGERPDRHGGKGGGVQGGREVE